MLSMRASPRLRFKRPPSAGQCLPLALLGLLIVLAGPSQASAQQTYFNVPNVETAAVGQIFVQNQLTLAKSGDTDVTIDVGLTKYLEVGLNVATIPLYAGSASEPPDEREPNVLANAQLTFPLARIAHVQLGTWQGIATGGNAEDRASYAGRGHGVLRLGEEGAAYGNYVFGAYAGTKTVLGPGSRAGGLFGAEVPLWEDRLRFAGDWVIGTNAESVAAVGLETVITARHRWEVAVAAQLPSPKSDNDYALLVQITHIPVESSAAK